MVLDKSKYWYCEECKIFICSDVAWGERFQNVPEDELRKHKDRTDHNKFSLRTVYNIKN